MSFGKIWQKIINYSNLKQIYIGKNITNCEKWSKRSKIFATKFNNQHKITKVENEKKKLRSNIKFLIEETKINVKNTLEKFKWWSQKHI